MKLHSATLRIIGTSEQEAQANLEIIQEMLLKAGYKGNDGTVQLSIEDVSEIPDITSLITFEPWSDEHRLPSFNVVKR